MPRLRLQDRFNCDCVTGAPSIDRFSRVSANVPRGASLVHNPTDPFLRFETHPSTRSAEIPVAKSVSLEVLINPRRGIFFRTFMSFEGGPRCCADRYINKYLSETPPLPLLRLFLSRNTIYKCNRLFRFLEVRLWLYDWRFLHNTLLSLNVNATRYLVENTLIEKRLRNVCVIESFSRHTFSKNNI